MAKSMKKRQEICPLETLVRNSPAAGRAEAGDISLILRLKRALRRHLAVKTVRRLKAYIEAVSDFFEKRKAERENVHAPVGQPVAFRLEAGDRVRVKTRAEIESTLGYWRSLKGCAFLSEMEAYCGTAQRVFKRVERFIDERDFRLKKGSGVVLLENLVCPGTGSVGRCDRACYFFWREEWLEKLDDGQETTRAGLPPFRNPEGSGA